MQTQGIHPQRRSVGGVPGALLLLAAALPVCAAGYDYAPEATPLFLAANAPRGMVLELRDEVAVTGPEVRLKHVIRCGPAEAAALDQTLEVVLVRFAGNASTLALDLATIKQTLEKHGVSLLAVRFSGAAVCRVQRLDDPGQAALLARGQEQIKSVLAAAPPTAFPATRPAAIDIAPLGPAGFAPGAFHTLRDRLLADVAERFGLGAEDIVPRWRAEDEKYLALAEPAWRFHIQPRPRAGIGDMVWDVTVGGSGPEQRITVIANIRVWRTVLRTTRALGYRQVIREQDIRTARVLVERLEEGVQLRPEQVIGSQTSRMLGPDEIVTASAVEASRLVQTGQLLTVTVNRPGVVIKWVAEARESGVYGQVIRVRRPGTRDEFSVRLVGPELGELIDQGEAGLASAGR
jgi:flagella basal body P-ring formation protein FlgA